MMTIASMRKIDFYRKIPVDLTEPTMPGAIISVIAIFIMIILFFGELSSYIYPPFRTDMFVAPDDEHGSKLKVNYNISLHHLPCFICNLDVLDVLGRHEVNIENNKKTRISHDGKIIGTFNDNNHNINKAEMEQEGCNIAGHLFIHKVPGNFHISAHGNVNDVVHHFPNGINVQHTIHHLHFGDTELSNGEIHTYEGQVHPLNGETHQESYSMHYEYFLDIVPTVYAYRTKKIKTKGSVPQVERGYQFTSNMHSQVIDSHAGMPAVVFQYHMSPITVAYSYERPSFSHFLTYMCAIIGGVFTVAGILSRAVHASAIQFQRKVLGKDQ